MNYNLPGSIAQHYHMDGIYIADYIICNVGVVDTDLLNGAIDLLPTTHREFYPFWRYALERKYRLTTRVPMAQGDVLLRRSTLWHRGMPNRTTVPRPMFSLTVGERITPVEDPILSNPSEIQFYANWYGTSRVSVLREQVEVALPITRSIGRFGRSLVGHRGYSSYLNGIARTPLIEAVILLGGLAAATFAVLGALVAIVGLYLFALTLAAFFYREPPRGASPHSRLTVLVPAHDEAVLVQQCVAALAAQDYPADLFETVVIADNCTDNTEPLARATGRGPWCDTLPTAVAKVKHSDGRWTSCWRGPILRTPSWWSTPIP